MKTAMQEAIHHFGNISPNMHLSTTQIVYILEQFIVKEERQIVKAFNDGHHVDVGHVDKAWEYYNEKYNQNK